MPGLFRHEAGQFNAIPAPAPENPLRGMPGLQGYGQKAEIRLNHQRPTGWRTLASRAFPSRFRSAANIAACTSMVG
jgi:hypothetical protein